MNVYLTGGRLAFGSGPQTICGIEWIIHRPNRSGAIHQIALSLEQAVRDAANDIDRAELVFVYVGQNAMDRCLAIATKLVLSGKLTIVSCDCGLEKKKDWASRHGVKVIEVACGGLQAVTEISEQLSAK